MSGLAHGFEPCPHCGEMPSRSWEYRLGVINAERILKEIGDDPRKRAAWRNFLFALRKTCSMVPAYIGDFHQGACDTFDKSDPAPAKADHEG